MSEDRLAKTERRYPEREIFAYGRYINCQILNWSEGPAPQFIVCNPLHQDYREPFLARIGMGTWIRVDLTEALRQQSDAITAAITEAVAREREACAGVADQQHRICSELHAKAVNERSDRVSDNHQGGADVAEEIATYIRNRARTAAEENKDG